MRLREAIWLDRGIAGLEWKPRSDFQSSFLILSSGFSWTVRSSYYDSGITMAISLGTELFCTSLSPWLSLGLTQHWTLCSYLLYTYHISWTESLKPSSAMLMFGGKECLPVRNNQSHRPWARTPLWAPLHLCSCPSPVPRLLPWTTFLPLHFPQLTSWGRGSSQRLTSIRLGLSSD